MLPKAYDPKVVEDAIYKRWEESGAFKPESCDPKGEPFTVSMPPPNATGQLHLGHAVMLALEDIFIRFARMQGKKALWVPGTDHAAIATESVVIKKIQKEEKIANPRTKYGREGLVAKIAEFVGQSQNTIRGQVRKMGSSCDWSRERYTMDPSLNRCVNEVFKKMYDDGLIYRGNRVVNWDTALQTTISDDEIEYKDTETYLYTIEYIPAALTGRAPVLVATSRPETKLGDTALVVHPDDERYKHLIGRTFTIDWPRGQSIVISVVADHTIDPAFGTGVLGLTPFHSKIDYEIWQRHKEEMEADPVQVIGEDGRMTDAVKGYAGMTVEECRTAFVEDLRAAGRLSKEEKYTQPLSVSYRSGKAVEVLPKLQWFIDVNKRFTGWSGKWTGQNLSLKQVMQDCVRSHDITIVPERFEKTYFQWIDNLQDWCISRQIWWGHRVPVWYKGDQMQVGAASPEGGGWEQDTDTLDTWFSSALWTWSTLIDPKKAADPALSFEEILKQSPDFQNFHPTSVMETGYDILFFWVARMILMTTYATGQIPFKTVYLHGLIRTRDGKKMSKSHPETMIDPLDIIPKYGADALRLSMIVGQSPGADSRLYEEKIAGYRNFVNKLWNASRFVLMQCEEAKTDPKTITKLPKTSELSLADRAMLSRLQTITKKVTEGLTEYRLSEAGDTLYSFVWDDFCDWYLELSKGNANLAVLVHTLRRILQLLHPYCPFVTEELWSHVKPENAGMLISKSWSEAKKELVDAEAEEAFLQLTSVIQAIRKIRAEQGIEPGKEIAAIIHGRKWMELLESQEGHIRRMGKIHSLTFATDAKPHKNAVSHGARERNVASVFLPEIEVHVPLEGLIDVDAERKKLQKEREEIGRFVKSIDAKLQNTDFTARAPEKVIAAEREKLQMHGEKLRKIEERLKTLGA